MVHVTCLPDLMFGTEYHVIWRHHFRHIVLRTNAESFHMVCDSCWVIPHGLWVMLSHCTWSIFHAESLHMVCVSCWVIAHGFVFQDYLFHSIDNLHPHPHPHPSIYQTLAPVVVECPVLPRSVGCTSHRQWSGFPELQSLTARYLWRHPPNCKYKRLFTRDVTL